MINYIEQLSELAGKLAAWMFFTVGFFVTYEVFMRYFFTMPTIWVDEVSRILQIWATFLAGGFALKHRQLIVIDVAFRQKDTLSRKLTETFAILVILTFSIVVVKYGFELWLKALLKGHTTDTFLAPPKWLTHGSVWFGFALISLQAFAELFKLWSNEKQKDNFTKGAH